MGKRRMINFTKAGFPQYEEVEEEGMAKPCAMGIPWVNVDTLSTLARRHVRRTGPKGEPVQEDKTQVKTSESKQRRWTRGVLCSFATLW